MKSLFVESEKELHQKKTEKVREGMKLGATKAKLNNITCIAFDLMKTSAFLIVLTEICYYKRQLWIYCLYIHGLSILIIQIMHFTVTILIKEILKFNTIKQI